MCIIIYKKENAILPSYEILKKCFANNNDGAGFCYVNENNNIKMEKGFFNFKKFYERLLEVQNNKHLLIHMRISTGGMNDKRNCHPYRINNNLFLAHNGVLPELLSKANLVFSDTYIYSEILKIFKIKISDFKSEYFKYLFEKAIGNNNKLVFFSKQKAIILNEKLGEWKDGVWFSNESFKKQDEYDYYENFTNDLFRKIK